MGVAVLDSIGIGNSNPMKHSSNYLIRVTPASKNRPVWLHAATSQDLKDQQLDENLIVPMSSPPGMEVVSRMLVPLRILLRPICPIA